MEFQGTLIAVKDMEISKCFYQELLGLKITADFGANVTLDGQIFLQTAETWQDFIEGSIPALPHNAGELYFEEEDLDSFLQKLEQYQVELVHPLKKHRWGQRVIRFYDPDGHIIEVGEPLSAVIRRFHGAGMNRQQIAERMDIPLETVPADIL